MQSILESPAKAPFNTLQTSGYEFFQYLCQISARSIRDYAIQTKHLVQTRFACVHVHKKGNKYIYVPTTALLETFSPELIFLTINFEKVALKSVIDAFGENYIPHYDKVICTVDAVPPDDTVNIWQSPCLYGPDTCMSEGAAAFYNGIYEFFGHKDTETCAKILNFIQNTIEGRPGRRLLVVRNKTVFHQIKSILLKFIKPMWFDQYNHKNQLTTVKFIELFSPAIFEQWLEQDTWSFVTEEKIRVTGANNANFVIGGDDNNIRLYDDMILIENPSDFAAKLCANLAATYSDLEKKICYVLNLFDTSHQTPLPSTS